MRREKGVFVLADERMKWENKKFAKRNIRLKQHKNDVLRTNIVPKLVHSKTLF